MSIFISLGWDCGPATISVNKKLRKTKSEGYMTCPFDLMNTNYQGIVECFKDDFQYLLDPSYIELKVVQKDCDFLAFKKGDKLIVNTKYNFIFNHESPNHGQLHLHENWANGPNHFCINNFEEFFVRYRNRVQNLKNYLNSGSRIVFINSKVNNNLETCGEIISVIKEKYPKLNFGFYFLDENRNDIYNEYLNFFNFNL